MNRIAKFVAGVLLLAGISTNAVALTPTISALTFDEPSGAFSRLFSVTPTLDDQLVLLIQGTSVAFDNLSFSLVGPAVNVLGSSVLTNGSLYASFNDISNTNTLTLQNIPYTLTISGIVKAVIGGQGTVMLTAINATVTPVPEPGILAMMLAGLGLIGTVIGRRSKSI